jgi:hypothetical protein
MDLGEFAETLKAGNLRASLEALRDRLALAMEEASSGVQPQIAAQLRGVLKDLDALPDGKKVTTADDLRNRREARRSQAAAVALASGDGHK